MFLTMHGQLIPISHPDYSHASTDAAGADLALRFFVEGAESCIAHAAEQGIAVEQCYGVQS